MSNLPAPVVLVHGIFGFGQLNAFGITLADYFRLIPAALRAAGHVVPTPPSLNPAASIAERAAGLKSYLNSPALAGQRVHLVAHSMGGLDARYMIAKLGTADRVISLTTIGTPHHGSPVADVVLAGGFGNVDAVLGHLGLNVSGVRDLTTEAAARFNEEISEASGIRYQSIGGVFAPLRPFGLPLGVLGGTHDFIKGRDGANDGLVSVASARFGQDESKWTFRGTWDGSHFRQINWGNDLMLMPPEWNDNGILNNYLQLVASIVAEG